MSDFLLVEWQKRIEEPFVFTGRQQASFDAEFLHGIDKPETVHADTDRADDTALVGVNFVSCDRNIIAAGCADILDHRIEFLGRIFGFQTINFIADVACLHRAATRTVDAHDHPGGGIALECSPQAGDDVVRARRSALSDDALHIDQCGDFIRAKRRGGRQPRQRQHQEHKHIGKGEQFKENTPPPRAALLAQRFKREALQQCLLPVLPSVGRLR